MSIVASERTDKLLSQCRFHAQGSNLALRSQKILGIHIAKWYQTPVLTNYLLWTRNLSDLVCVVSHSFTGHDVLPNQHTLARWMDCGAEMMSWNVPVFCLMPREMHELWLQSDSNCILIGGNMRSSSVEQLRNIPSSTIDDVKSYMQSC